MSKKLDITALARQARLPFDDPGVQAFAELIACECVRIAGEALAEHDRELVGLSLGASAVRAQGRLRDAFELERDHTSVASDAWSDQVEMLMLAL